MLWCMTICACVNQNGGAGKTTTALALAVAAADAGRRVLAVDLDAQHVLTRQAGLMPVSRSIVDVFAGDTELDAAIVTAVHGCDWLPGHPALADVERGLARGDHGVTVLAGLLAGATGYDLIVLDAPPTLGQLALNALGAATRVLVPVNAQNEASAEVLLGVMASMDAIGAAGRLDLIITRYDARRVAAGEIAATLDGLELPDRRVLPPALALIPDRAAVHRAGLARQPLVAFAPNDPATAAYRTLADLIMA
jgi:chromosome partitioning protein